MSGDTLEFFAPRGPNDSFGVINDLAAGDYEVELISYERAGGSDTELYAAAGTNTSWNSDFRLIGDTANGGLAVTSDPFDGSGSSSAFASLIQTDVKQAMQTANNASLYSRITFDVADPQLLQSLTLKMKYDDGYVAYLNGVEIARRNAPATIAYDSPATAERTDSQAIVFENVNVSPAPQPASVDGQRAGGADHELLGERRRPVSVARVVAESFTRDGRAFLRNADARRGQLPAVLVPRGRYAFLGRPRILHRAVLADHQYGHSRSDHSLLAQRRNPRRGR